jgi:DNA end-binding protein Ku
MPRAIWTGAISFGLVTVPVKLYAAVQSKTVKFNQLDAEDHSRIAMKRTNAQTGEEVPYDRIVKGFEIAPDRYVVLEPQELESLDPRKTKTIDIEGFVELSEVDPIYFDHPYAMRESGRVGIAKVVIRSKQQLVALRPIGDVLAMSTMVFHDEVVPADTLDEVPAADDVDANPRELEMATALVESLTEAWEPEKYHDTYREEVLALIERKAAGEEIAIQPAREEPSQVPDLMSALKASLDAVRKPDAKAKAPSEDGAEAGGNGTGNGTSAGGARKKAPAKKAAAGKTAARKPAAKK